LRIENPDYNFWFRFKLQISANAVHERQLPVYCTHFDFYATSILIPHSCISRLCSLSEHGDRSDAHLLHSPFNEAGIQSRIWISPWKGIPPFITISPPFIITALFSAPTESGSKASPNAPSGCKANIGASIASPSKTTIF
jgi:hypothetical protein